MTVKPGYKQSEVGLIPEDWSTANLFDLADKSKTLFDDGDWIESKDQTNAGIRLIQTGNIGRGTLKLGNAKKYISESTLNRLRCKQLLLDDILICRLADPAGRSCLMVQIPDNKAITSVDVTIFRPPTEFVDRRFLVSVFSTSWWFAAVADKCGGSTRTRISRKALGSIQIPLPSKAEQETIAEALSDADALIESLEQLIAKKRQIKQGAMQQLLTGRKRLPGFYKEWQCRRVDELGTVSTGGTPATSVEAYWNGSIPWVTPTDISSAKDISVTERMLTNFGLSQIRRLPENSVLVTYIASIGKNAVMKRDGGCNQQINALISNAISIPEFLYYLFEFNQSALIANAGTTATSIISKKTFSSLEFFVPQANEQTAIAEILSDMDAEITELETKLAKARQVKQSMMQQLFTGRIRLVEPQSQPIAEANAAAI